MSDELEADDIRGRVGESAAAHLDALEVLDVVPSTNTWLMQQERHDRGRFHAVLAEHQTAGRGRRSRRWFSPPNAGICLSVSYTFRDTPGNIACLTLAAGVAVREALASLGVRDLNLKWPNDLYADGAKLGGILTDAQTASASRITMICGVGLNVDLSVADTGIPDSDSATYAITDIRSHADRVPTRSEIAAAVIEGLIEGILRFEAEGLEPFRAGWNEHDELHGQNVTVEMPDGIIRGVADGIDANGALRVQTSQGRRRVFTGDVRVHRAESA